MEFISVAGETSDINLPAFEFPLANTTNPLIVERIPSPEVISRAQDRQPIVECDMSNHNRKTLCSLRQNRQSGRWMII
jgi:hypothetical protein